MSWTDISNSLFSRLFLATVLWLPFILPQPVRAEVTDLAPEVLNLMQQEQPWDFLIQVKEELPETDVQLPQTIEGKLKIRKKHFQQTKTSLLNKRAGHEWRVIHQYAHLPMLHIQVNSLKDLRHLAAQKEVVGIFTNEPIFPFLSQSLPLIQQPKTEEVGRTGQGTAVAVIDTGVNYTSSAFGSCTAPGLPASCKVVVDEEIQEDTGDADSEAHGTNVAGIVLGVAPDTNIISLDVFNDGGSTDALAIEAINWAIAHQVAYNIVAINMSLGGSTSYSSPCSSYNPYTTAVNSARAAGITVVAASGNAGASDGIARPACTPGVVSVGAVYDQNLGSQSWSACSDSTTIADQVTCFSNSADFLDILAPGAKITAAGYIAGGTSQATPHVAGAAAILKAEFPSETPGEITQRLINSGVMVTDHRNSLMFPRLDLLTALGPPANDDFSARLLLNGTNGTVSGDNANATNETGEPDHAGITGDTSTWWSFVPDFSGRFDIDTHGSSFDTLLAVYTGSAIDQLDSVAFSNDDGSPDSTSGLSTTVQNGIEYQLAVTGNGHEVGKIALNWSLITTTDLSVSLTANSENIFVGEESTATVQIDSSGPSDVEDIVFTVPWPDDVEFVSAPANCTFDSSELSCTVSMIPAEDSAQIEFIFLPLTETTVSFSVQIEGSDLWEDSNPSNDSSSLPLEILDPEQVPALSFPWFVFCAVFLTRIFRKS